MPVVYDRWYMTGDDARYTDKHWLHAFRFLMFKSPNFQRLQSSKFVPQNSEHDRLLGAKNELPLDHKGHPLSKQ